MEDPESVVISFTGDILLDRGVREFIEHHGTGAIVDPSAKELFQASNIIVGNLECPVTTLERPLNKKYIFRAEPEWLEALKGNGFTHLNLANNHSMDQSRAGLTDTKNNIEKAGMVPLGYGKNEKGACKPYLLTATPRPVYIFSSVQVKSENWTYLPDKECICEKPVNQMIRQVRELREQEGSAFIIVQLHWGREHSTLPELSQKQQARELIDAGADCIIGHHPHTIQEAEYYKGKPIFYSLGNFIFDQRKPVNQTGLVVQIWISSDTVQYKEIRVDSDPSVR